MKLDLMQARRQEFSEGGSSTRVAFTAGGLGAAQGPQKLWGIWNKILKSSNFQCNLIKLCRDYKFIANYKTCHIYEHP